MMPKMQNTIFSVIGIPKANTTMLFLYVFNDAKIITNIKSLNNTLRMS
jgi:hypothetical protein